MRVQALHRRFAGDGSGKATSEHAGRAKKERAQARDNRSSGRRCAPEQHRANGSATEDAAGLAANETRIG